ncbi:MAG: undecaprenyl-diphosphate phosphatase [Desulfobacteraceae bacterium]
MEIYQGIILGIVQGLTEFLPVSSSGHLVLGQRFLGITEPALAFDISVHMGTFMATAVVFRKEILSILKSLWGFGLKAAAFRINRGDLQNDSDIRISLLIITGSIPTACIGFFLKHFEHMIFSSVTLVGIMLIFTGTFLWLTRFWDHKGKGVEGFKYRTAFWVGVCQGLAVIPGVSRSGFTISAAVFAGIDRRTAAKFSFLLSLPAIFGAQILSLKDTVNHDAAFSSATLYGTVFSFITGYLALVLLLKIVNQGKFYMFAPYCWILGVFALLSALI